MRHRDRHGRTAHPDNDRRRRPSAGYRLRHPVSFERILQDALAELSAPVARAVEGAAVEVGDVPDGDADLLVRLVPDGRAVRRLTVYRRPAEQRAADRTDLTDLLREAIESAVADALGLDRGDWD